MVTCLWILLLFNVLIIHKTCILYDNYFFNLVSILIIYSGTFLIKLKKKLTKIFKILFLIILINVNKK